MLHPADHDQIEIEDDNVRTEAFQPMSDTSFKRVKIGVGILAFFIFLTITMFPSMTLVKVNCVEDNFANSLLPVRQFFSEH